MTVTNAQIKAWLEQAELEAENMDEEERSQIEKELLRRQELAATEGGPKRLRKLSDHLRRDGMWGGTEEELQEAVLLGYCSESDAINRDD